MALCQLLCFCTNQACRSRYRLRDRSNETKALSPKRRRNQSHTFFEVLRFCWAVFNYGQWWWWWWWWWEKEKEGDEGCQLISESTQNRKICCSGFTSGSCFISSFVYIYQRLLLFLLSLSLSLCSKWHRFFLPLQTSFVVVDRRYQLWYAHQLLTGDSPSKALDKSVSVILNEKKKKNGKDILGRQDKATVKFSQSSEMRSDKKNQKWASLMTKSMLITDKHKVSAVKKARLFFRTANSPAAPSVGKVCHCFAACFAFQNKPTVCSVLCEVERSSLFTFPLKIQKQHELCRFFKRWRPRRAII